VPITTTKFVPDPRAAVTIRMATEADAPALYRLAVLDSGMPPIGPTLVAEVGAELWAAVALDGSTAVADPFRPSGELLLLLAERSRQLAAAGAPQRRRRRFGARARRARPAT
jgi:hypothetical protein